MTFRKNPNTQATGNGAHYRYARPLLSLGCQRAGSVVISHLGGWHDFRHTLATSMRRAGVHPKVVSGILGHARVALAMNIYDHADVEDFRQPLAVVAEELLRSVTKAEAAG